VAAAPYFAAAVSYARNLQLQQNKFGFGEMYRWKKSHGTTLSS
jgi:hypothetical protein